MNHRRRGWRTAVVLVACGWVVVGCRADDPADELRAAAEATAADSFTFAVTARADPGVLDDLGVAAADAAAFLRDLVVDGEHDGDGTVRVGVRIGGTAPVLEASTDADGPLYLRSGLPELLGATGADAAAELGPALDAAGVSADGRAALIASFEGGWVALTDVDGLGELLAPGAEDGDERPADGPSPEDDRDLAATDLDALLAATRVTGARTAGDVRRFDVEVATAAVGERLGPPATVAAALPGTVVVRDGRVVEVRLELVADGQPGTVELVATFADHGADVRLTRPQAAATLTSAQLVELATQLEAAGALPTP